MVGASIDLDTIERTCLIALDDASSLAEQLGIVCLHLASSSQRRAEQVLGRLIAVNSSRMLTTVWTVLFSSMREAHSIDAKLCIIRQFAKHCGSLPPQERSVVFRVFSTEVIELLESDAAVVDRTFIAAFSSISSHLVRYAEPHSYMLIVKTIKHKMTISDSKEVLRAVSLLLSQVLFSVRDPSFVDTFFSSAKEEMPSFAFALCVDQATKCAIEKVNTCSTVRIRDQLAMLMSIVEENLCAALFQIDTQATLPTVVSSYCDLKNYDRLWVPKCEEKIVKEMPSLLLKCTKAFATVAIMKFLSCCSVNWSNNISLIWKVVDSNDQFVSCAAYDSISKLMIFADDEWSVSLLPEIFQRFENDVARGITQMVCGSLKLLTTVLTRSPCCEQSTADLARRVLATLTNFDVPAFSPALHGCIVEFLGAFQPFQTESFTYMMKSICLASSEIREQTARQLLSWLHGGTVRCCSWKRINATKWNFGAFLGLCLSEENRPQMNMFDYLLNHCTFFESLGEILDYGADSSLGDRIQSVCSVVCAVTGTDATVFSYSEVSATLFALFSSLSEHLLDYEEFSLEIIISLARGCTACLRLLRGRPMDADNFRRLFNTLWNMLHRCCLSLDPVHTEKLHGDDQLLFSYQELSFSMEHRIASAADSAFTNSSHFEASELHSYIFAVSDFLEQLIILCSSCDTPEYCRMMKQLVLFPTNILDVLMDFCPSSISRLMIQLCAQVKRSVGDSSFLQDLQRMVSWCSNILMKRVPIDIFSVGEAVFELTNIFLDLDIQHQTSFYEMFDGNHSLMTTALSVLCASDQHSHHSFVAMMEDALRTILKLFLSPYMPKIRDIVDPIRQNEISTAVGELRVLAGNSAQRCERYHNILVQQLNNFPLDCFPVIQLIDICRLFTGADASAFLKNYDLLCICMEQIQYVNFASMLEAIAVQPPPIQILVCCATLDTTLLSIAMHSILESPCEDFFLEFLVAFVQGCSSERPAIELHFSPVVISASEFLFAQLFSSFTNWRITVESINCVNSLPPCLPQTVLRSLLNNSVTDDCKQQMFENLQRIEESNPQEFLVAGCSVNISASFLDDTIGYFKQNAISTLLSCLASNDKLEYLTGAAVKKMILAHAIGCRLELSGTSPQCAESVLRRVHDLALSLDNDLRCACAVLAVNLFPFFTHFWEDCLDGQCQDEQSGPHSRLMLDILSRCIGLNPSADDSHQLAAFVVSKLMDDSKQSADSSEQLTMWLTLRSVARCMPNIIRSPDNMESSRFLTFLCQMNATIGFPLTAVQEVCACFTPQFPFFGDGSQDVSRQRMLLYLVASLLHLSDSVIQARGAAMGRISISPIGCSLAEALPFLPMQDLWSVPQGIRFLPGGAADEFWISLSLAPELMRNVRCDLRCANDNHLCDGVWGSLFCTYSKLLVRCIDQSKSIHPSELVDILASYMALSYTDLSYLRSCPSVEVASAELVQRARTWACIQTDNTELPARSVFLAGQLPDSDEGLDASVCDSVSCISTLLVSSMLLHTGGAMVSSQNQVEQMLQSPNLQTYLGGLWLISCFSSLPATPSSVGLLLEKGLGDRIANDLASSRERQDYTYHQVSEALLHALLTIVNAIPDRKTVIVASHCVGVILEGQPDCNTCEVELLARELLIAAITAAYRDEGLSRVPMCSLIPQHRHTDVSRATIVHRSQHDMLEWFTATHLSMLGINYPTTRDWLMNDAQLDALRSWVHRTQNIASDEFWQSLSHLDTRVAASRSAAVRGLLQCCWITKAAKEPRLQRVLCGFTESVMRRVQCPDDCWWLLYVILLCIIGCVEREAGVQASMFLDGKRSFSTTSVRSWTLLLCSAVKRNVDLLLTAQAYCGAMGEASASMPGGAWIAPVLEEVQLLLGTHS